MGVSVISRPDITVETISSTDHISRWLAVNADYPVIFHLRRQDYDVSSVIEDAGKVALVISGVDVTAAFEVADTIYFSASVVDSQTTTVTNSQTVSSDTLITTNVDWPVGGASDVGSYWVNLLSKRADYSVQISLVDAATNLILEQINYQPFKSGDMKIDIGAWAKAYLSTVLDTTYPTTSRADENSAKSFYLKWLPTYTGSAETETTDTFFYYGVNAANQLQNENGVNFADYVGFDADLTEANKAKFLTVFDEPQHWPGYPFKLGYVVDRENGNPTVTRRESHYEDDGTLTGSDTTSLPATDYEKVNHIALSGGYASNETVVNLWLESTFPPSSSCGLLDDSDWLYNSWLLRVDESLDSIFIDVNSPTTDIDTIDSYPAGILYNDSDVAIDTVSWNGTAYVPDLDPTGHIISGTWRVEVLNVSVTTKAGDSCTHDFIQEFTNVLANQPPSLSGVGLSSGAGVFAPGETLTCAYTYSDVDGDTEDTTATVASITWKRFDAATGTAGETTLQTGGTTYVVQAADVGKYIEAMITPHANTGTLIGNAVTTPRSLVYEVAYSGSTDKQTAFTITQTGGSGFIDWGDGTSVEAFDASGGSTATPHTYASAGTYAFKVYCDPTDITRNDTTNEGLVSSLDISNLTSMNNMDIGNNSGLTSVSSPTSATSWSSYAIDNCGLTGTHDLSGATGLAGNVLLNSNSSLTGITFPTSSGNISLLYIQDCDITGVLNISGLTGFGGSFTCRGNSNLTGITNPTTTRAFTTYQFYNCDVTGTLNLSTLTGLAGQIRGYGNSNLTGITFPSASGIFTIIYLYSCDLTGTVDLSPMTNIGGDLQLQGNANLTGVTLPTNSRAFSKFRIYDCDLTGTLDISMLTGIAGEINFRANTNLTGITHPASSGTITTYYAYGCNLDYVDITNLTFSSAIDFDFSDNSMVATDVNHILVDLDNTLPGTGTGTIDLSGTNAAPDGSSGGYDGTTAKANLIASGYTLITS